MAILSRDFGIKICLVIADAEEKRVQILSKLALFGYLTPANNITEILPVFHCYFNEILLNFINKFDQNFSEISAKFICNTDIPQNFSKISQKNSLK